MVGPDQGKLDAFPLVGLSDRGRFTGNSHFRAFRQGYALLENDDTVLYPTLYRHIIIFRWRLWKPQVETYHALNPLVSGGTEMTTEY